MVQRILHEQLLHPYHFHCEQAQNTKEYPHRFAFCQWILDHNLIYPHFGRKVLFNSRNSYIWHDEYPHSMVFRRYQEQFSVNMWTGIVRENLIVYLLPAPMNVDIYLHFLQNVLPLLLENDPLD